jgi:RNA polymerase sigma-70 factor (ECF subfamily)
VSASPEDSRRSADIEHWIGAAHDGSRSALGRLLEAYRPYLLLVANQELSPELMTKAGASDLVQESFLEAQRDFEGFRGKSESELRAWLRRILLNNIAHLSRLFRDTDKRQLDREVAQNDTAIEKELLEALHNHGQSPSSEVADRERDAALERSMAKLPELHRQVIRWRNYERCAFEEIGGRLGRSAEAARKLWARAVEQLQQLLDSPDAS